MVTKKLGTLKRCIKHSRCNPAGITGTLEIIHNFYNHYHTPFLSNQILKRGFKHL